MTLPGFLKNRIWSAAWRTFSRAFILLGLPLLAWGVNDTAGFFSEPARTAYATVVLLQALAVGWLVYITPLHAAPERSYDLSHWHAHIYEIILLVAAYGDRHSALTWNDVPGLRWVGVGLALLATVLGVWASVAWTNQLHRDGSFAAPDPVLFAGGPFRWVRYPALLSMPLLSLGFSLLTRSWVGLALMAPLAGALMQRIAFLERDNAGRYGRAWLARCRTSWRIVPFLY